MNASPKGSLLVIGPGYVGLEVACRRAASGARVYALCRSSEKRSVLEKAGIIPLAGDFLKTETLPVFPAVDHVFFSSAPDAHAESDYEAVYIHGLRHVLSRLKEAGKVIWLSSTSVWGDPVEGWVDEWVPAASCEKKPQLLLEAEKIVLKSGFPSLVFRLSGIYGPGRNRITAFKEGRWPEAGTPLRYLNLIHREDIVRGAEFLFEKGTAGEVYLGTDTEPLTNREAAEWLAEHLQRPAPLPEFSGRHPSGKRCRPSKLRSMGFQFTYPGFREGYRALIAENEGTRELA